MPDHPPYNVMVMTAISELNQRGGSSRQAIAKYISENYDEITERFEVHVKMALKRLLKKRLIVHTKGTGAVGSFTISPKYLKVLESVSAATGETDYGAAMDAMIASKKIGQKKSANNEGGASSEETMDEETEEEGQSAKEEPVKKKTKPTAKAKRMLRGNAESSSSSGGGVKARK